MKVYMKVTTDLAGQKEELFLKKDRAVAEAKQEARMLLYKTEQNHNFIVSFRNWCGNIEGVYVKEMEVIE